MTRMSHLDPLASRPIPVTHVDVLNSPPTRVTLQLCPLIHTPDIARKSRCASMTRVQFIRSWIEKPLSTGAVMPSGKALARTMARYVDPQSKGPVIELGPGTGPVTEALVAHGIDPARLVLVEFNPISAACCARAIRRRRWCKATPIGCAVCWRRCARTRRRGGVRPAAGHQAVAHPPALDLRRIVLLAPGAPFVQFTYAMVPPIPRRLPASRPNPPRRSG